MRADRLLSIMLLLQVHQRVTSRELARRLEVSERTIHRDMDALGAAGIPVYAERGVSGGWADRYWDEAGELWPPRPPGSADGGMQRQHQRGCEWRRGRGEDWEEEV